MGGDDAPARVVEGALLAVRELGLALELVGPVAELEPRLAREPDRARLSLTLVDAPEHVGMADRPRDALRKRATSIRVAVERVRTGEVSGLFSAGHTGATVVAAVAGLGLLPGVDRPALAVTIPTARGQAVLLDVGATVDCQPAHLRQFAAMGCAYAQVALGRTAPRVGLLSIGEEALKGDQLTREAFRALETSGLPFVGNVEACNLFDGDADVVVCDGFTGNIALKISEGVVDAVARDAARGAGGLGRCRGSARRWRVPRSAASRGASTPPSSAARRCSASTACAWSATAARRRGPCATASRSPAASPPSRWCRGSPTPSPG